MIRRLARTGRTAFGYGLTLALCLIPTIARAQEAGGAPAEPGDPTYTYIGAGLLAAGIMFLICKSSRRSP